MMNLNLNVPLEKKVFTSKKIEGDKKTSKGIFFRTFVFQKR